MKVSRTCRTRGGSDTTSIFFNEKEMKELENAVPSKYGRYVVKRVGYDYHIYAHDRGAIIGRVSKADSYMLRQRLDESEAEEEAFKTMQTPKTPQLFNAIPATVHYSEVKGVPRAVVTPDWGAYRGYSPIRRRGGVPYTREAPKPDMGATVNTQPAAQPVADAAWTQNLTDMLRHMKEMKDTYNLTYYITPEGNVGAKTSVSFEP